MKRSQKLIAPLLAAVFVASCSGGASSLPGAGGTAVSQGQHVTAWDAAHPTHRACPLTAPGFMHCDVLIEDSHHAGPAINGWQPTNFQARYNLPITKGKGQVVAVIDAYDNPDVATDLAAYRTEFNLGTANFTKYNQLGQTSNYPTGNPDWGVEIALDVEMVSASCPNCTIDLIEANSNSGDDLYDSEAEAVKLGATILTNSWGGGGGSASGGDFDHKGVTYLASAGDGAYGTQDPADYSTVVAVGGTVLSESGSVYSEVVWPDTGGGCSVVAKPTWQKDKGCKFRTDNDLGAIAANAAEYDTYDEGGWITVDGTSISSPLVAGMYGLAGNSKTAQSGKRIWKLSKKAKAKDFHTISSGTDGCPASISGSYLCTAGTNQFGTYSGPTGWGTPNGVKAL